MKYDGDRGNQILYTRSNYTFIDDSVTLFKLNYKSGGTAPIIESYSSPDSTRSSADDNFGRGRRFGNKL